MFVLPLSVMHRAQATLISLGAGFLPSGRKLTENLQLLKVGISERCGDEILNAE